MTNDQKFRPELSFTELSLIVACLRESPSQSANKLSRHLNDWATELIDSQSNLHKMILNLPVKDRD